MSQAINVQKVDKVESWLKSQPKLFFKETNHTPWGSYAPAFSQDNRQWVILNRFFGFGFKIEYSAAICIVEAIETNQTDFLQWLGFSILDEIKTVIDLPDNSVEIIPTQLALEFNV